MCCDADMVFHTSLSGTPGIESMIMYSEPTGLVFVELHESTEGTGMVVSRFTLRTVSQAVTDQACPVAIALTEL
jgi:hypothetical protein